MGDRLKKAVAYPMTYVNAVLYVAILVIAGLRVDDWRFWVVSILLFVATSANQVAGLWLSEQP